MHVQQEQEGTERPVTPWLSKDQKPSVDELRKNGFRTCVFLGCPCQGAKRFVELNCELAVYCCHRQEKMTAHMAAGCAMQA